MTLVNPTSCPSTGYKTLKYNDKLMTRNPSEGFKPLQRCCLEKVTVEMLQEADFIAKFQSASQYKKLSIMTQQLMLKAGQKLII